MVKRPYNFVSDFGVNYHFGVFPQVKSTVDEAFHLKIDQEIPNPSEVLYKEKSVSDSSSESSDENDDLEKHCCRLYSCKDPECYSCDLTNDCYNCSHCDANKSLGVPCTLCPSLRIHSIAEHKGVRCPYHKEFPRKITNQFSFSYVRPTSAGKYRLIQPLSSVKPKTDLMLDRDKLAKYVAARKTCSVRDVDGSLLQSVLEQTYSQCEIGRDLKPKFDLNVDTSRYEEKPFVVPKEIAMPLLCDRKTENAVIQSNLYGLKNDNLPPKKNNSNYNIPIDRKPCNCPIIDTDVCPYPTDHTISKKPSIFCDKKHASICNCHTLNDLLFPREFGKNDTVTAVAAHHHQACLDINCPLRRSEAADDSIFQWFNALVKLERIKFQCPLNPSILPHESEILCGTFNQNTEPSLQIERPIDAYITNLTPRPLFPDMNRRDGVAQMAFWDRLNCFQERYTDHRIETDLPMIFGINKPIFNDQDENIGGRYDGINAFWDRNKIFTPKKILVKKPETLVKLIETDDLPLKFEALHILKRSTRLSRTLQNGCGDKKVILPLLDVLDHCEHDGIRRQAIYILSMALRHPPGRCVFFELGPDTVSNLYSHYLRDDRYAMRRAFMLVLSNLVEDSGVSSMLCNSISFENTFSNMCEEDPDLQMYLMKMIFHAMHDIEGREKIASLPEFRLTPVLLGCLNKRARIREMALNLLDAIVSFCKQDVIIKTFRDNRGIKVLNKILRKPYMAYAHPIVLKLYDKLAENPEAGLIMKEGSLANLVEFVETVDDPKLIAHTLRVLVKMARDPLTKEVLALTNVIAKVAPLIVHTNEELAQSVLMIIELMAAKGSRNLITQQLVKADPMVDLLWVVGNENRGWDTRVIALRCIIALLNLTAFFGECYIRCKNATNVINLLCHQAKFLTTYSKTLLVQVLSALAKSKRNYEFLIRNKTVKALLYSFKCFDSFESQLYAHSIGLLAAMMKDRRAVVQFSNVKNSYDLLAEKFVGRQFVSADILMNLMFLITNLTDNFETGAKAFLKNGLLAWLVGLKNSHPDVAGSIQTAIGSIIDNYLPLKFAHCGYLHYQDLTNRSLFFVTKDPYDLYTDKTRFPIFDQGISNQLKPSNFIYYFNLSPSMRGASFSDLGKDLTTETSDDFNIYATVSRSGESVHKLPGQIEDEVFLPLENDPKLEEIFSEVKKTFEQIQSEMRGDDYRRLIGEILGLARIVGKTLMGYDPDLPVSRVIQEIYLDSVKEQLGTNVVPIGKLLMGCKFERAILFKVLADSVDLPCWLTRSGSKIAWNEVYIPKPVDDYQRQEMIPTHVVDLMSSEPRLLSVNSAEARAYLKNVEE